MVYKGNRNYATYAGVMEVDRPKMVPHVERLRGKQMNEEAVLGDVCECVF